MADPADILAFWFEETEREAWFKTDPAFDQVIRDHHVPGSSPGASTSKINGLA